MKANFKKIQKYDTFHSIRLQLEQELQQPLDEFKAYIDEEILHILGKPALYHSRLDFIGASVPHGSGPRSCSRLYWNPCLFCSGQMDPASKIFDFLFLGSEWNASNLEVELYLVLVSRTKFENSALILAPFLNFLAQLYISMYIITFPGYGAYNIFHSMFNIALKLSWMYSVFITQ